jgi:uncharacterized membrane protein
MDAVMLLACTGLNMVSMVLAYFYAKRIAREEARIEVNRYRSFLIKNNNGHNSNF